MTFSLQSAVPNFLGIEMQASSILKLVLTHHNPIQSLCFNDDFEHHFEAIRRNVLEDRQILFILPAFPAKSASPEKTLNALPDYGEYLALERLQNLCDKIKEIYSPGAEILICSDGRVFNDLVGVNDDDVRRYTSGIEQMLERHNFFDLKTIGLDDFYKDLSFDQMRANLVTNFGSTLIEIRQNVISDLAAQIQFNGIHRFIFEDLKSLGHHNSKNQIRNQSKQIAYQVIQRSNAWSVLLEKAFPQSIRLSIHPQPAGSKKIGIQLVNASNIWATPWHNVAITDGKDFRLMKRSEAEFMGARLSYSSDHYPYFSTQGLKCIN